MYQKQIPRLTAFYRSYLNHHRTREFVDLTARYYNEAALLCLTGAENTDTRRAAALALGLLGTYQANTALGKLLKDSDRSVRLLAEGSIKSVWTREGSEEQRQGLYSILRQIGELQYGEALRTANNLLDTHPFLIETRNQRAIALFALKDFENSIADSEIVLDLNPYHFGAAVGMGHAYLQLNNKEQAVACFQRALDINPNLETIRRRLGMLTVNL
ncbi:MAG: tetratricopeptide repeat protein [Planctomycetaceae bacterium]|jgi:tetratricopeptide (TPR) repeat protein|nr:tetratricopeptide repeat protein [Planctomycetaceae bacterium]